MHFKNNNIYIFHGDKSDEIVIVTSTKDDLIHAIKISDGSKISCILDKLSPVSNETQKLYDYMLKQIEQRDNYIDELVHEIENNDDEGENFSIEKDLAGY